MKRIVKYLLILVCAALLLLLLGVLFLWHTEESETHALIDALQTPVTGHEISPQNTLALDQLFFNAEIDSVPRLFLTNFPADFPQNGNPVLFAKALAPLILRANEHTLKERAILKILSRKNQLNQPWTLKENLFFNQMLQKYDCTLFKTRDTQLNELLIKVDAVPVSLAIIQAGIQTDWGRRALKAPFGEKMWFDRQTYADRQFDSLIDATDSYILSLNATIPYYKWRMGRQLLNSLDYKTRGSAFAGLLAAYNPDDKEYTQKLMSLYRQTRLITLDQAKFRHE